MLGSCFIWEGGLVVEGSFFALVFGAGFWFFAAAGLLFDLRFLSLNLRFLLDFRVRIVIARLLFGPVVWPSLLLFSSYLMDVASFLLLD